VEEQRKKEIAFAILMGRAIKQERDVSDIKNFVKIAKKSRISQQEIKDFVNFFVEDIVLEE